MNTDNFRSNSSDEWERLVEAHKEYLLALNDFFSNKEAAIDSLRKALRGKGRLTAIAVVENLHTDDVLLLFDELVFLASFSHGAIQSVRDIIVSLPRNWVLSNIESSAEPLLRNGTYDEYRRFLELYSQLDRTLALKLAQRAFEHSDDDVKEVGEEYLESLRGNHEQNSFSQIK